MQAERDHVRLLAMSMRGRVKLRKEAIPYDPIHVRCFFSARTL